MSGTRGRRMAGGLSIVSGRDGVPVAFALVARVASITIKYERKFTTTARGPFGLF